MAGQSFRVGKASVGYIYDFPSESHYALGVGALVSKYALPAMLAPAYGDSPTSFMLFARVKIK